MIEIQNIDYNNHVDLIGTAQRGSCQGVCEFVGATLALGNVDANIWLIDMTETEMKRRMQRNMTQREWHNLRYGINQYEEVNPVWLWERGYKEQVIKNSKRQIERNRKHLPSVWRVLIDERNALMAARLAWIISEKREKGQEGNILAFVGAAHVDGIRELLEEPLLIQHSLKRFNLSFTEPTLMRKVAIQGN